MSVKIKEYTVNGVETYRQNKIQHHCYLNRVNVGIINILHTAPPGQSKLPNCGKHLTPVSFYTPFRQKLTVMRVVSVQTFSAELIY